MGHVLPLRRTRVEAETFLEAARAYVSCSESAYRDSERLRNENLALKNQLESLRAFCVEIQIELGLLAVCGTDPKVRAHAAELAAKAGRMSEAEE